MKWMWVCAVILIISNAVFAVDCTTSKCHGDVWNMALQKKNVHGPFKASKGSKGCVLCHVNNGDPLQKDVKLPADHPKLVNARGENANSTCLACHDDIQRKQDVPHKVIATRGCVECHDPHASNHPKLFRAEATAEKQCLECHRNTEKDLELGKFHTGEKTLNACLKCHSPHGSKHGKLLRQSSRELCLSCHDKRPLDIKHVILANAHFHGKSAERPDGVDCIKCHASHTSVHGSLLKGNVISAKGNSSRSQNPESDFGLCFQCHTQVFEKTNFRNGSVNLHSLHNLRKKKALGCFACHDAHASKNKHLIRESFPYFGRDVELKYGETNNGGNCATACHAKFGYER